MEEKKKTRIGLGIVIGVLIGLFVGMVGTFCFFLLSGRMVTSADPTKVAGVAPEEEDTSAISDAVIMKMKLVEEIFDRYYLEEDLDKSELPEDIYHAMVNSMGDKYSTYYSAEEYKKATEDRQGMYYGIGAYVTMNKDIGYAVISGVMDDSPALEAGVRTDDIIYEIEGESAYNLELDEIVRRIKGPEGTTVHITFIRNEKDEVELEVERRAIESKTVSHKMLEGDIG
ncbi:MAG: PDZ domain-containing protein, partial [Lachnospiraceae bacterium]|nr:PDZ domain-containing protein [Lachnospiraceae bacterium]